MCAVSIAAVILAAGDSTRLGRPKQDVVLGDETLLNRAVRVALEAGLAPVIAVVREARYSDDLQQQGVRVVLNRKAHEGMASSIVCGVMVAQTMQALGVVLMTCDQPALQPEHLRALANNAEAITGSAYSGRVGVPAYFPATAFGALMDLKGDIGARELLRDAMSIPQQGLSVDIDTEEDFRTAQILFER
jgi:molybdenum cofactor cytidylyltransferase